MRIALLGLERCSDVPFALIPALRRYPANARRFKMVLRGKGDPFKAERDKHPESQGVGCCNKITVLKKPKAKEAMALLEKIATVRFLRLLAQRTSLIDVETSWYTQVREHLVARNHSDTGLPVMKKHGWTLPLLVCPYAITSD